MRIEHSVGDAGQEGLPEEKHPTAKGGKGTLPLAERAKKQRKAFLKELEAMMRLRSPHTVNVYGAVTSRKNELVLIMELMAGGDLRTRLKNAKPPLDEGKARITMKDVSAGVAFLHSKKTIHGDLKSANVLFDREGRAKVGGWAQALS